MSEQGEKGEQGMVGQTGDTGATGISGERGATGDLGPRGIQGVTGQRGRTGESTLLSRKITLAFIAVVVVAFLTLVPLGCAISANRNAIRRTCEAVNETRAVNNRDRLTLIRSARDAEANAATVEDPTLKRLLLNAAKNTRAEVAARPYLERLSGCASLVPFPPKYLSPTS
jgi:collagen triple helix repeat protein